VVLGSTTDRWQNRICGLRQTNPDSRKTCDERLWSILDASHALTVSSYTKAARYKCSLQTLSVLST
jgi:hypothetical protein